MTRLVIRLALLVSLLAPASVVRAEGLSDAQRETVQADVSEIRELLLKEPVAITRVSQSELRSQYIEELEDPEVVELLKTTKKYNVLLGTIPADIDLRQVLVNTLSGAVIGQYRPMDKTMYLVAEPDAPIGPDTKIVIAHEFTHALQDQYFGLEALSKKVKDHDDRAQALRALFEGDASITELLYERDKITGEEAIALGQLRAQSTDTLITAPFILQEELKFPYVEGFFFVVELWQRGGFAMIDAAYANPPVSTEQILHPEKYLDGEAPVELGLPDLLPIYGPEWRQTYANVMGELELRILIEQFTDSSLAGRAAEGWGGDAFAVLEGPGEHVAWIMDSVWDTDDDALEFAESFTFSLGRRFGTARVPIVQEPAKSIWSTPVGTIGMTHSGSRVALVYAPDRTLAEGTLTALSPESTSPRLPVATPVAEPVTP